MAKRLSKSSDKNPPKKKKVQKIPPTASAARDEGPRLLPLGERAKEPSALEHYLDLADIALGTHKKPGPETGE